MIIWEAKILGLKRNFQTTTNDLIAYFSAEYGLDETIPIYSGGLGILSGDHMKSSSDMGIPLVGVGLLYKSGYFHQKINGYGQQETEYHAIDISLLPLTSVKDHEGKDLLIYIKFPKKENIFKSLANESWT